jgi:hypothetical protein
MAYFLLHTGQPSARRLLQQVTRLHSYTSSSAVANLDTTIRYGLTDESDPAFGRVQNPRDAVLRTTSRTKMANLLRRIGIRVASAKALKNGTLGIHRQYRIPLFDLEPLACFRAEGKDAWINQRIQQIQDVFDEIAIDTDRQSRRVSRFAMRTLHALGLDHGLVSIGVAGKGVLYILDVTASPVLQGRMLELFCDAVTRYIETDEASDGQPLTEVAIGSDLEVMLRNPQGKMVLASRYFTRRGRIGCDDRSVQMDGKRLPLLEFRPDPAQNPVTLVSNLRQLMTRAAHTVNREGVEWRAGSMPFRPYCTGGHIHFSGVPFSSYFVRVLDNYLGIPLMLIEDNKTAELRRPKYGFLGDVRMKPWGFEYRTPASFIVSPEVTAAAFCLAYVIAVHHRELPVYDVYEPNVQFAFYQGEKERLRPLIERNLTQVRKLRTYEQYREMIEPFFRMIETGATWDENMDVRLAWGVPLTKSRLDHQVKIRRRQAIS